MATLREQIGMSLKARALHFSRHWGKKITAKRIRKYYRGHHITLQVVNAQLGRVPLQSKFEQTKVISKLKTRVKKFLRRGYMLVQIDECTFTPNRPGRERYWSVAKEPFKSDYRYHTVKPVGVIAAISKEAGLIEAVG